jgi:hypothetical protein
VISDQRGIVYLETLIALPIVLIGFLTLMTFGRLCVAHLIVQRAASAGVRAAVVILPDDKEYYGPNEGAATKEECVEEAVRRVLMASPHFLLDQASIEVALSGTKKVFEPLRIEVRAQYDCRSFLGSARFFARALCGDDRVATIASSATLPYQLGPIEP